MTSSDLARRRVNNIGRVTTRGRIMTVAEHWRLQYQRADGTWSHLDLPGPTAEERYRHLRALDVEAATPADVAAIVAPSWIAIVCDVCEQTVDAAIEFDRTSHHAPATVCGACIRYADLLLGTPR
jgi:hypothetical protein